MNKLKILCVIEGSAWDGAKEQTYLFLREMSKYHQVDIALNTKFTKMAELVIDFAGIQFFEKYSKVKLRYNVKNWIRLLNVINQNSYDVIITQSSVTMQYLRLIHPWIKGKPKIIAVKRGGTIPNLASKYFKYGIADQIVVVSNQVKTELEKSKSHQQPMRAIESGVDLARYFPDDQHKDSIRKQLGINQNDKVYINVANWELQRKRQHLILNAFAKLKRQDCKLFLVGNATNGEEAKSLITRLGLTDQVLCLGFREDIPDLLRASDFFVLSSKAEGIAGSLLQAMACGKLVLSTKAGGIGGYLKDGINGFSCEVEDINQFDSKFASLLEVSNNDMLKITEAAIKTAHQYSLENNINQWLALLEEMFPTVKEQKAINT